MALSCGIRAWGDSWGAGIEPRLATHKANAFPDALSLGPHFKSFEFTINDGVFRDSS